MVMGTDCIGSNWHRKQWFTEDGENNSNEHNIMTVDTKKNSFKIEKKNSVSQLYLGILFFTMKNHL
jgi:hypothetical protein